MNQSLDLVASDTGPDRLDVFLSRRFPDASRRVIQELIATGGVRLNGRRARKGHMVHANDSIWIADPSALAPAQLRPQSELQVRVICVDAEFVAVDKPPGMPSQALRSRPLNSVANFLAARFPEVRNIGAPLEGGLVHRLDNGTSGVLLAARTAEAYDALRLSFRQQKVEKFYLAIVRGDVAAGGSIRAPIAGASPGGRRMSVCTDVRRARARKARRAVTHYRPLHRYGSATLIEVTIATGVRHQIRVHLASIGHPILGDELYNGEATFAPRPLLHARELRFPHPLGGKPVAREAPPPADFVSAMEKLAQAAT